GAAGLDEEGRRGRRLGPQVGPRVLRLLRRDAGGGRARGLTRARLGTLGSMDEPRAKPDALDPDATAEGAAVDPGYALAERVRAATFRQARRGYDRREGGDFLAALADDLRSAELGPTAPGDPDAVRRELERVGESTASIL